jgi:hypothetical protein
MTGTFLWIDQNTAYLFHRSITSLVLHEDLGSYAHDAMRSEVLAADDRTVELAEQEF